MHTVFPALLGFKIILSLGLALWSALTAVNNRVGFGGATFAVGRTFSMAALQEPPQIPTPMLGRAVTDKWWARAAVIVLMTLQAAAAILLLLGGLGFIGYALAGSFGTVAAMFSTLGVDVLAAAWLLMMCGGLWFGYWFKQEGLQNTHIGLLTATIAAAIVFNL